MRVSVLMSMCRTDRGGDINKKTVTLKRCFRLRYEMETKCRCCSNRDITLAPTIVITVSVKKIYTLQDFIDNDFFH